MAENKKVEELNDDELDQVTGGNFFDFFSKMQVKLRQVLNMPNSGDMKANINKDKTMLDEAKNDKFI